MRQFAERVEAVVDLIASDRLQALRAEALDRERPHHAAVEHGVLQHTAVHFSLRGDVAHEAPGEAVARAGGVAYFVQRQRGSPKRMMPTRELAITKEDGGTVLTVLDDQRLGTE